MRVTKCYALQRKSRVETPGVNTARTGFHTKEKPLEPERERIAPVAVTAPAERTACRLTA